MARLLLGVSGSIAAYKALELIRLATAAGHVVRVVQTEASERFVGRASFAALTGAPVLVGIFDDDPMAGAYPGDEPGVDRPIGHLALAERADLMIIAPASGTLRRTSVRRRSAAASTAGIHSPFGSSAVRHACAVMSFVSASPRRALTSSPALVRQRI